MGCVGEYTLRPSVVQLFSLAPNNNKEEGSMDFIELFAECSITFAGFAALHSMMEGSKGPRGALRAWSTVFPGILVFCLCIFVLLLDMSNVSEVNKWRYASAVGAVAGGMQTFLTLRMDYLFTHKGHPPQARGFIRSAQTSALGGTLVMLMGAGARPEALLFGIGLGLTMLPGVIALIHSFWLTLDTSLEET